MPKNIILKNKKNPLSKKVFKSKKLQKWPKKGQKWPFFGPPGPNFAKIKKRLGHSLTFTPERLYTKFQKIWLIRLGENALRTNGRTDGRTDGTEIIGPSGKIPGTNESSLKLIIYIKFYISYQRTSATQYKCYAALRISP